MHQNATSACDRECRWVTMSTTRQGHSMWACSVVIFRYLPRPPRLGLRAVPPQRPSGTGFHPDRRMRRCAFHPRPGLRGENLGHRPYAVAGVARTELGINLRRRHSPRIARRRLRVILEKHALNATSMLHTASDRRSIGEHVGLWSIAQSGRHGQAAERPL